MILSDIGQENNLKNEKMLKKVDKMRKTGSTATKRKYTRKIKILENIPLEEPKGEKLHNDIVDVEVNIEPKIGPKIKPKRKYTRKIKIIKAKQ